MRIRARTSCLPSRATAAARRDRSAHRADQAASPHGRRRPASVFKQAIEIPSVHNRGQVPRMAKLLADQFRAAGIPDSDIHFMPYEALPGDKTEALIVRWRSPHATKKPMLILGHMDVVEAKRVRLEVRPVRVPRGGRLFLGRGTSDMKNGDVATTMAAVKLMGEGFKPDRDIIFFYSGDEETSGRARRSASTKWRNLTDAEFGLNADGGCAVVRRAIPPAGLRHLDGREDLPDLFPDDAQSRRAQQPAAPRQCDLRSRRCAGEGADLPLPADAERSHSRPISRSARSRRATARLARQSAPGSPIRTTARRRTRSRPIRSRSA